MADSRLFVMELSVTRVEMVEMVVMASYHQRDERESEERDVHCEIGW